MNPRFALGLFALLAPVLAEGHATAAVTSPARDSVLKVAPVEFVLKFNEAAKLAKVTLQKTGDPKATDIGPLPAQSLQTVKLPAPKLGPGEYLLRYRALSDDGHIAPGVVKFTIAP